MWTSVAPILAIHKTVTQRYYFNYSWTPTVKTLSFRFIDIIKNCRFWGNFLFISIKSSYLDSSHRERFKNPNRKLRNLKMCLCNGGVKESSYCLSKHFILSCYKHCNKSDFQLMKVYLKLAVLANTLLQSSVNCKHMQ